MKYLGLWEFSRKQDYIFRSNRLVENIGASLIIKELTENVSTYGLREESVVIRGGGKTLYIFKSKDEAESFNKKFSTNVLKSYPGLEVFMVLEPFDDDLDNIKVCIERIYKKLERKKAARKNLGQKISFGIERVCESTALPAAFIKRDQGLNTYISSEIHAKRKYAQDHQNEVFQKLIPKGYRLTREIGDLVKEKRNGEEAKNYISIVHIDGNGMGKKFKEISDNVAKKSNENMKSFNERYIQVVKKFSSDITKVYENAFIHMCEAVVKNKEKLTEVCRMDEGIFPVRPIILAGDDVTFIANGYIGVELAKEFIKFITTQKIEVENVGVFQLNACGGIVITRAGNPFNRAYELAEDLCKGSKERILIENHNKDYSAIDFHIVQGDIFGSIQDIREEQYKAKDGKLDLTMKPLYLNKPEAWKTYDNFIESFCRVNNVVNENIIGRNKIKEMRSIFKDGEEATRHFFRFYKIKPGKYFVPLDKTLGDYCFFENTCMYLDAIESYDYFIKLS